MQAALKQEVQAELATEASRLKGAVDAEADIGTASEAGSGFDAAVSSCT